MGALATLTVIYRQNKQQTRISIELYIGKVKL